MPKCYSDHEKEYIRKRLKEEAAKCLARYGIRRTTVDEIVKGVRIPKGTFYLFYQSKELLLFEVLLEQHDTIEQDIVRGIASIDPAALTVPLLTDVFLGFFKKAAEMPMLNMLNSDEVELLTRKLPQEVIEEHLGSDQSLMEKLLTLLPVKPGIDGKALSAAFLMIFFSTLHKEEIGDVNYDEGLRCLIKALVMQII